MSEQNYLVDVLSLAGGEIVGRVRLQKVFFLLDCLGMNSDFEYEYHYFGPYSDDLANELYFATQQNMVEERIGHRLQDGARYSVFCLLNEERDVDRLGTLPRDAAQKFIGRFKETDATILELAATIVWLKQDEGFEDWELELRSRKGSKVTDARVKKAKDLLSEVGIEA